MNGLEIIRSQAHLLDSLTRYLNPASPRLRAPLTFFTSLYMEGLFVEYLYTSISTQNKKFAIALHPVTYGAIKTKSAFCTNRPLKIVLERRQVHCTK